MSTSGPTVRVVVTGAEGFIGSTLTDLLVEAGADVTAFAHYKPYGEHGYIADHVQTGRDQGRRR